MRFSVLGSGSSGNATYVETDRTRCLIDAGLSARETGRRLAQIGRRLEDIDVILVSHEHDDHTRGLEVLTRKYRLSVASSRGTLRLLRDQLAPGTDLIELPVARPTRLHDLEVEAMPLPHDAVEPFGFRISAGCAHLGHVTDLGSIDRALEVGLEPVTALLLESNHDTQMVTDGPYPWSLKQRLLSPFGHLSNDAVADYLRRGNLDHLALVCLAHLSRTNNRPDLAEVAARLALDGRGCEADVFTASHDRASALTEVPRAGARATPPPRRDHRSPVQMLIPFELWPTRRVLSEHRAGRSQRT